jgi:hypothetical protein
MHTGSRVLCAPVDAALAALVELNGAASRDFLLLRFFLSDALAPRGHARLVADRLRLLSHAVASSCTLRLFDGLRASAATSVALVLAERWHAFVIPFAHAHLAYATHDALAARPAFPQSFRDCVAALQTTRALCRMPCRNWPSLWKNATVC